MLRTGTGFRLVGYRYTGTNRYRCVTGLKRDRNWTGTGLTPLSLLIHQLLSSMLLKLVSLLSRAIRYWQNPIISSVLVVLFIGFSLDATHDIQHRSVNGNGLHTNTGLLGAIEGELEKSIFKAGGIRDSNFGNFYKIGWARSSRTDKGVHSLATMISLKMEIPEDAWEDDPNGITLANCVNSSLPENIKVFGILPSKKLDSVSYF
ncbi:hypothetical protein FXO37_36083 [Capsicum annuum]|nr:hypothetical protein FXO37_36083 [Capsicum annuum]